MADMLVSFLRFGRTILSDAFNARSYHRLRVTVAQKDPKCQRFLWFSDAKDRQGNIWAFPIHACTRGMVIGTDHTDRPKQLSIPTRLPPKPSTSVRLGKPPSTSKSYNDIVALIFIGCGPPEKF